MAPRVVHCQKEPYDVFVARPSKWGNPFRGPEKVENIAKYYTWLHGQPEMIEMAKRELRGKTLGCWCAPAACHADILLKVANE